MKNLSSLPNSAGVGYKPQHLNDILAAPESCNWIEIHAENYMGDGGRPIAQLKHLAEIYPVSCHGVGLSIGAEMGLDKDHLQRLKKLNDWLQPASFSEHLAWSTHDVGFLNDLLPVPYTQATLSRVVRHIDQLQDVLGRKILLENPSTYLAFDESEMSETDYLSEIAKRSGCGLLLDVNNVFVSATNQNQSPEAYINAFPLDSVGEIHLGGHEDDQDETGAPVLIDSHSRAVVDPVWELYDLTIQKAGPRPTLIEWDADIPDWATLADEVRAADTILQKYKMAAE